MSLFETLLVVILGVYVLVQIYFGVTGRILSIKARKEDLAIADKSLDLNEQISVLTKRLGEISTEAHNLREDNIKWKDAYNNLFSNFHSLQKKYGDLQQDGGVSTEKSEQ